jgi:hypothetical protein
MRISYLLSTVILLVIVLPLIGLVFGDGLVRLAAQIILTVVLILAIAATGVFGYICLKAQAKKWGVGLIVVAIICLLVIFIIWTGKVLLL